MASRTSMSPARILLVEDERVIALGLARRVPRLGYTVAALATSAHETVTQVDACRPNLMFMNISLPGPMNGLDAAAQIGAQRPIPVVYLMGHAETNPLEGVRPSGPFLYLHKLIDEQTLRETMARVASPLPPTLR
jgi:CheY-like chemotaxis protein